MFQFSYIPFLTVTVLHPFYADGISTDFDFAPTPATDQMLTAYGFRCKTIAGKCILYQQLDGGGVPFQEVDRNLDLFFKVIVKTDILNVTGYFGEGKYWFSNLKP